METLVAGRISAAVYGRPCRGERVSGDIGVLLQRDGHVLAVLADVLGHGRRAHGLAVTLPEHVAGTVGVDPDRIVASLHAALAGSLGAAVSCVSINASSGALTFAGVGNVGLRLFGPHAASAEKSLVPQPGTAGRVMDPPRLTSERLVPGRRAVLFTDGLKSRFGVADYAGILHDHPTDLCAELVDRFGKVHDDATVLVIAHDPE